jgi:hypothetical protein
MLSTFGTILLMAVGLGAALISWRRSERARGEASIRATNLALAADARRRAAAAEYVSRHGRDDVVHELRRTGGM